MKNNYYPQSIEELQEVSDDRLEDYWNYFYRYPLKGRKRKYRSLWYAMQCKEHKIKLAEKYITRLDKYAKNQEKYIQRANKRKYEVSVGTILTKVYKGKQYQVTVKGEKQYEYEDNIYPNLTLIAEKITRGHVSGPRFFGLTRREYEQN